MADCNNNSKYTTTIPFQAQQPIFSKVGNIAELVHMTPEERRKYNISIDSYRTNLSVMKNERAEGEAEGMAKGVLKVATKLKSIGVPISQIMQATGLSEKEIEEL